MIRWLKSIVKLKSLKSWFKSIIEHDAETFLWFVYSMSQYDKNKNKYIVINTSISSCWSEGTDEYS